MNDLLFLVHEENTTTGTTQEWCESRGLSSRTVIAAHEKFDQNLASEFRALIVFGGDMETFDEAKYPWLKSEKAFLRETMAQRRPIFGLCLGAQLLAEQLGASIGRMGKWEIGWYGVHLEGSDEPLVPLHWHSSYFELPAEAKRIATNSHCVNQGFQVGERWVGYQFHCEIDETRLHRVISGLSPDTRGIVQSREQIVAESEARMAALKRWYFARLDRWWKSRT